MTPTTLAAIARPAAPRSAATVANTAAMIGTATSTGGMGARMGRFPGSGVVLVGLPVVGAAFAAGAVAAVDTGAARAAAVRAAAARVDGVVDTSFTRAR